MSRGARPRRLAVVFLVAAAVCYAGGGLALLVEPQTAVLLGVRPGPPTPAAGYLARIIGIYGLLLAGATVVALRPGGMRALLAAAPSAHLLHALQLWRGSGPAAPGPDRPGAAVETALALSLAIAALSVGRTPAAPDVEPARRAVWRRAALAGMLLFTLVYHATQGFPALCPSPAVLGFLELLYGWGFSGLAGGDFDLLRIYAIIMLVTTIPVILALRDPHRGALVVRASAALFGAKALLMLALRHQIQLSFHVSDVRFAVQVCTIGLLAAGLAALAPRAPSPPVAAR